VARKENGSARKTTKSAGNERAPFVGYVNVTLTDEDKIDYEAWLGQGDLPEEAYHDALAEGYQFTIKFDSQGDCFQCAVSRWDVGADDAGIIYTGRSSSPRTAMQKAVYVLSRKLNWSLWNGRVAGGPRDAF